MMNIRRLLPGPLALTAVLTACGGTATPDATTAPRPATSTFPSSPPSPLPVEDVSFPDYDERVLRNGARLLVVENHEQPVVTIQLMMPGGSAADPTERPGLASLAASQIDKGTASMSSQELAEAVDFLGASLGAGASSEWTSVYLTTLTDFLDRGLELLSDVVVNPTFPEGELATEKQRRISNLRLQLSQPAALAQRSFMEGLYGDHPYGRLESVESIEAIGAAALRDYHSRFYRPEGALFVVAGDVDPDEVARALEVAFAGWEGRAPGQGVVAEPPSRADRSMLFVHKPGSVQAVIRIGHLFPSATEADWVTLDVVNQVLGSGSAQFNAWMMRILREEKGYTYGANSAMAERRGPGYFVMNGEFRNEVADSSLLIMLELADRLRRGDVPEADLEDARLYLTGSFPLGIETPQQVAGQVAINRLLGRPDSYLTEYRGRVAAVEVEDVARAAREHIRPERMLVVVVGDAAQVLDRVRPFVDEVTVVDAEGEPLDPAALAAAAEAAADLSFDASGLEPRELTYSIRFQGNEMGTVTTRWSRQDEAFVVETAQRMPQITLDQRTEFNALTFVPTRHTLSVGPIGEFTLDVEDGRATGQGFDPQQGPTDVDVELGPGTALQGQVDIALAVTDFDDVGELTLQVLTGSGTVQPMTVSVVGEETVEVPAGTFDTYRIELSGEQPMTVWVTRSDPHIVVRRELAGQPVSIVLTSM